MNKSKIKYLRYYDILFITIIMFGLAIYSSTLDYINLKNSVITVEENLTFTSSEDWSSFKLEILQLSVVFIYLYFRKFNFSAWKFKFNFKVLGYSILLFALSALIMDISSIIFKFNSYPLEVTGKFFAIKDFLKEFNFSLIPFSMLNGFFEEIFFLGICLQVKEKYIKWAFLYSLIIRFSFHTYQGLASSLTIALAIGCLFYYMYEKKFSRNLSPFIIAHVIADIIGASIIWYIIY